MDEISKLTQYIENLGGYDLHSDDLGRIVVPGWEGFPVWKFQYLKVDPNGVRKIGLVALLDASPQKIATWIYNAIGTVLGNYDADKAKALADECFYASGFQFPVRGIHWENMSPIFTAYTFFNGVTVRLKNWDPPWPDTPLGPDQLEIALQATIDDVEEAMRFARIQSTTRSDYGANGGTLSTAGKDWLDVSRQCYQAAWNSDSNVLMTAKARAKFTT